MGRWQGFGFVLGFLLVLASVSHGAFATRVAAAEDWTITSFHSAIPVQSDGRLDVTVTILVDFGGSPHHGIVREIPVIYDYDQIHNRRYDLTIVGVTSQNGESVPFTSQSTGSFLSVHIGDPNVEVSELHRLGDPVRSPIRNN